MVLDASPSPRPPRWPSYRTRRRSHYLKRGAVVSLRGISVDGGVCVRLGPRVVAVVFARGERQVYHELLFRVRGAEQQWIDDRYGPG